MNIFITDPAVLYLISIYTEEEDAHFSIITNCEQDY